MGYQALLFCPDEKTARTVTQVLSELDFTVVPCTEPFAAVKQLIAERFDAVVVDCDNEQNATLLFKSARNAASNQSSLAVAVVEGQAGVAKAFRIGANLVLTKPINLEQAKGTLRVARGLLRKGEAAKTATPVAGDVKPALPVQAASKSISQAATPTVATPGPAAIVGPAPASIPTPWPPPQPGAMASASTSVSAATVEPKPEPASRASSTGFRSGAASAPAPARETISISSAVAASKVIPEHEVSEAVSAGVSRSSVEDSVAPSLAFAGVAESGGGSRKALIAVAALVVIAAAGYGAWTQWGRSTPGASVPAHVAAQPANPPAPASAAVPPSTAPASAASQPAGIAKTSSPPAAASAENTPHPNKITAAADSGKPAPSALAPDKAPTAKAARPIVIKNDLTAGKEASSQAPEVSMNAIAGAGSGGALPSLMSGGKAPTPLLQTLSISQGVSQGLLLKKVQPTYPQNALRMHVEGSVELLATVSRSGEISAVKILSGEAQLAHAAADAVKQWKYKPYLLNGSPVEIQTQVTVNFKLPR